MVRRNSGYRVRFGLLAAVSVAGSARTAELLASSALAIAVLTAAIGFFVVLATLG